jgi:glycosyltransferase involved in cell wall biosynthesis
MLIPNGVFFHHPEPERMELLRHNLPQAAGERHICLTVANLSPQKGHTYLLEAIADLPTALRQSWYFVLAGTGELEVQLQTQAEQLGIFQNLIFLGHTSDVPEWLALADAFVLPSLYEGLPLALLEAMAAGLPCIATAVDGNLDVLRHEENGLLCAPASSQHLSQILRTLLSDAALRARLGKQAQTDYRSHWTFERTWQQYESLYQQLCQSSKEQMQQYVHSTH